MIFKIKQLKQFRKVKVESNGQMVVSKTMIRADISERQFLQIYDSYIKVLNTHHLLECL